MKTLMENMAVIYDSHILSVVPVHEVDENLKALSLDPKEIEKKIF